MIRSLNLLKMNNEKFCLRWNDFENNISSAFRELRDDKDFFDVTLACEDEEIQAHKVILSACSPFFLKLFRRHPHQHPLLYLKNVKYGDLQAVLNFMYHGEVNVAQEELNSFLTVAEDLKVKGLTQKNSESQESKQPFKSAKDTSVSKSHQRPPTRDPIKPPRPNPPSAKQAQYEDIQEYVPIKSEPREPVDQSNTRTTSHQMTAQVYSNQPVALTVQEDSLTHYQEEEEEEGYEQYGQYEDQYGHQQVDLDMGQTQGGELGKGESYIFQFYNNSSFHVNHEILLVAKLKPVINLIVMSSKADIDRLCWGPP